MNKVITIHLRGRAYQLEESGYNKLQDYLEQAKHQLEKDPDKDEIISDLEQAIAEKLNRFLNSHKSVALEKDVDEVIKEMGPVQSSESEGEESQSAPKAASAKRLYLIREGAKFRGVCTGLAAYFDVDVTLIRVIFVLLTILAHGLGILIYLILMLVLPHAETSAQKAEAFGEPFTAQELIDRARTEYSKFADKGEWKKWKYEFKQKIREEKYKHRRQRWEQKAQQRPSYRSPFMGLLMVILALLWVWGTITLLSKGIVFGLMVPATMPLWVALLIWLCLYGFVMASINGYHYSAHYEQNGQQIYFHHHDGFFETVVWLAFTVLVVWFLWRYVPATHPALEKAHLWLTHIWQRLGGHQ